MAYSLDVVGERWTLLIVRELLFGPRRYTDLLNGLPGIGTNLLAKRLKQMEQADIIRQRTLPPPASSTVYELTERGRGLQEPLMSLAKWGMVYLQVPPPLDHVIGVVQGMELLQLLFDPTAAAEMRLTCEIHAGQDVFYAALYDGVIDLIPGPAAQPDLVIHGSIKAIIQHIMGAPGGGFAIETGDAATFEQFAAAFRAP
jgi:DNA-binding HxlR family transcriptional regulator